MIPTVQHGAIREIIGKSVYLKNLIGEARLFEIADVNATFSLRVAKLTVRARRSGFPDIPSCNHSQLTCEWQNVLFF